MEYIKIIVSFLFKLYFKYPVFKKDKILKLALKEYPDLKDVVFNKDVTGITIIAKDNEIIDCYNSSEYRNHQRDTDELIFNFDIYTYTIDDILKRISYV